jgi:hypothetical protein
MEYGIVALRVAVGEDKPNAPSLGTGGYQLRSE